MKREIEFSGQRAENKDWVYGDLVRIPNGDSFDCYIISDFEERDSIYDLGKYAIKVIPETVGKYTGIKDKNGKKIFEHDIVKTKYGRLCRVVRVSLPSYVGWDLEVFDENNALTTKKPDEYDLYYKDNLEVVGNIFDKESDNE